MAKQRKKHGLLLSRKTVAGILVCLFAIVLVVFVTVQQRTLNAKTSQLTNLREYIFSGQDIVDSVTQQASQNSVKDGLFVVFISVCDTTERARVFTGTGAGISEAWEDAEKQARSYVKSLSFESLWVKADIVTSMERIPKAELNNYVVSTVYQNFFRYGIALDDDFNTAFLEAEISGNKLLSYYSESEIASNEVDYTKDLLHLQNINYYLSKWQEKDEITETPDEIIIFTTQGFFCDETNQIYDLYSEGMNTGRRVTEAVDDAYLEPIVLSASQYLYDLIQPDGQFIYGYYPVFDNLNESYNILRHASSLWSLINLYRMTEDGSFIEGIDSGMDYLVDNIVYKDDNTAYLLESKSDELKLGGNGVAIIAMTEYMDVFGSDKYISLVEHLANGILEQQNADGTFYHVLNYPDFSQKEAYRTVYYDGEATFGLARAYTYTGQEKYLDAAQLSIENFIENDYTRYRDHWVAYSLYEVTKYVPEERYFEFALKNVEYNLERIYNQTTSYHTYLELLAISWQTYENAVASGIDIEYLNDFDVEAFAQTLYKRANYMLNSYFFPEYAMYMKNPQTALGTFFVRHDSFRIRIDDIQHFIGGYYYFIKNYDSISSYLSDDFIKAVNDGDLSSFGTLN